MRSWRGFGVPLATALLLAVLQETVSFNCVSIAAGSLDSRPATSPIDGAVRLRGGSTFVDEMKVEALRAIGAGLRRGGHGTARRKFKVKRQKASKADEAKFQSTLKRLNINAVTGMGDVEIFNDDGTIFYFKSPKVYCNVQANAFIVQGDYEVRRPNESSGTHVQVEESKAQPENTAGA